MKYVCGMIAFFTVYTTIAMQKTDKTKLHKVIQRSDELKKEKIKERIRLLEQEEEKRSRAYMILINEIAKIDLENKIQGST